MDNNADIVRALIDSLNARDFSRWLEWLQEDCVQNLPYAPEGFPKVFAPAKHITGHFEEALAKRDSVNFYDIVVTPAADPDVVFAEFKQDSPVPDSDSRYQQTYIHKFVFKDGRIVQWDEYFNPITVLNAFGGLEAALEKLAAN